MCDSIELVKLSMNIIKKPKKGSVGILYFEKTSDQTIIVGGSGNVDCVCGKCGAIILKTVYPCAQPNYVYLCNKCNKYNILPDIECRCVIKQVNK